MSTNQLIRSCPRADVHGPVAAQLPHGPSRSRNPANGRSCRFPARYGHLKIINNCDDTSVSVAARPHRSSRLSPDDASTHSRWRNDNKSVARVTEIIASSSNGFDDALKDGIDRASKTLKNVTSAWIKDQSVEVDGNKVVAYKVTLKVTFVLED